MFKDVLDNNHAQEIVTYPERPFVPPIYICMLLAVLIANLVLYRFINLPLVSRMQDAASLELSDLSISSLEIEITADATKTDSGYLALASCVAPSGTKTKVWVSSSKEYVLGTIVRCVGRFSANDESDWGVSNRARGIAGRIKVVHELSLTKVEGPKAYLISFREALLKLINPSKNEPRALLAGVLLARRTELKQMGLDSDFANAGLSHLIAVSGSHLVIVSTMLETLLSAMGISAKRSTIAVLFMSALYVLLCATPTSAVRSWIMLALARVSIFFGRRAHTLTALGFAGTGMLIQDIYCACDLGFQLSMLSVSALTLFSDYFSYMFRTLGSHLHLSRLLFRGSIKLTAIHKLREFENSLLATLICQAATFCACGVAFNRVSLIAPIANVLIGALFGPLVCCGLVGSLLSCLPIIGALFMGLAELLSMFVIACVKALASMPLASLMVAFPKFFEVIPLIFGTLLYIAWPRFGLYELRLVFASLLGGLSIYILLMYVLVPPQIVVLDVGQGDAVLVRQGVHALLIDTGPSGALTEALARNHVVDLDAIFLTHLHDDHVGGLDDLKNSISVGGVYVAKGVASSMDSKLSKTIYELTGATAQEFDSTTSISLGGFSFLSLWPKSAVTGNENEDSLCVLVNFDSFKMLLVGDAESDVLSQIEIEAGDIDVLKVGHHGSRSAITSSEANALKPELSVASAGQGNSYGHPSEECIETLTEAGSQFLCTKDRGDIYLFPTDPARVACAL